MQTLTEVYCRTLTEEQARLRVAFHGYGQATPEDASRGRLEGEHVFIVHVQAKRLPDRCILSPKKAKKRR